MLVKCKPRIFRRSRKYAIKEAQYFPNELTKKARAICMQKERMLIHLMDDINPGQIERQDVWSALRSIAHPTHKGKTITIKVETLQRQIQRCLMKAQDSKEEVVSKAELTSVTEEILSAFQWNQRRVSPNDFLIKLTDEAKIKPKLTLLLEDPTDNDWRYLLYVSFGQIAISSSMRLSNWLLRHIHQVLYRTGERYPGRKKRAIKEKFFHHFVKWDAPSIMDARQEAIKQEIFEKHKGRIVCSVGADPEFELYKVIQNEKGKKLVDFKEGFRSAERIFNIVGLSPSQNAKLGVDGNTRIVEIRPSASTKPTIVAKDIKRIITTLANEVKTYNETLAPIAGGGFLYSIGGHIHIGHPLLEDLNSLGTSKNHLVRMLDDFLYLPMKQNNAFATRGWSKFNEIRQEYFSRPLAPSYDTIPSTIHSRNEDLVPALINKTNIMPQEHFTLYDMASQYRQQNWGIEYRSLPSFIVDYNFTRIVLRLAQKITEHFLQSAIAGLPVEYNRPTEEADYLKYINKEEYRMFRSYICGKNKAKLTQSLFKNWKVKYRPLAPHEMKPPFIFHFGVPDVDRLASLVIQDNRLIQELMQTLNSMSYKLKFIVHHANLWGGYSGTPQAFSLPPKWVALGSGLCVSNFPGKTFSRAMGAVSILHRIYSVEHPEHMFSRRNNRNEDYIHIWMQGINCCCDSCTRRALNLASEVKNLISHPIINVIRAIGAEWLDPEEREPLEEILSIEPYEFFGYHNIDMDDRDIPTDDNFLNSMYPIEWGINNEEEEEDY